VGDHKSILLSGQCKEEATAKSLMGLYPDAASVHIYDMLADTEAIAGACVFIYAIEFAEWLEYDAVVF
jgi:hypothetical protein